jgi:ABC-type transport system substrate-binding protein
MNHHTRYPFLRLLTTLLTFLVLGASAWHSAYARNQFSPHPVYGGNVSIRDIFGTDCIDPMNLNSGTEITLIADPLIAVDAHGRYQPSLALGWKYSNGGKILTLNLRRGVRFSNGHPFNAAALKQNFEYLLEQPGALAPLESVRVIDKYTLKLVYSAPFRAALDTLTTFLPVDLAAERAQGNDACKAPIATGPFKVSNVGPGFDPVTLVRNPYHTWESSWLRNKGGPYVSKVTVKTVVEDTQATSELLTGDLDLARVSPDQLPRLQGESSIAIHRAPDVSDIFLGFNHAHAPFNNQAVRRAIAQSIDRKGLIKAAYGGLGVVDRSIVPPSDPYTDAAAGKYIPSFNPKQAARVLRAHHVTGPFVLETYTIPVFNDTAQFIQAELARVGIKVNLVVKAVSDAQVDMGKGQMDMYIDIWNSGNDLYSAFHSSQTPANGAHNWNFMHDTSLDHLIVQARETISSGRARTILNNEQSYVNKHTVVVPLFTRELVSATRSRVHDYHYVPGSNTLMWPAMSDLYVTK